MSAALAPGLVLLGVLTVFGGVAARLVPWRYRPLPAATEAVLDEAQCRHAGRFHAQLRPVRRAGVTVGLAVPLLLGLTPAGAALIGLLPGSGNAAGRWTLAVLLLVGTSWACGLPTALLGRGISIRFGLDRQRSRSWWADQLKSLALAGSALWLALGAVLWLIRSAPATWWVIVLVVGLPLVLLVATALPPLVEAMFARCVPMADGPLRVEILALAARAGVSVSRVLVADASRRTTALNAYVAGLGPTRRIVVYDTLLACAPVPEVLSVLAHELGHARHRDVLAGTVLGALGGAVGICAAAVLLGLGPVRALAGVDRLGAIESAPLLGALATVGSLLTAPLWTAISRRVETRADHFALTVTGDPAAFLAVHRRLAATNLEDLEPSWWRRAWYGTHPTTAQRIALARLWRSSAGPPISSRSRPALASARRERPA